MRSAARIVRAATKKWIEYDVAPRGAVENSIGHKRNRLYRRVELQEPLAAFASKCVRARVGPDIGPVPTVFPELDIVAVSVSALLKYEDQLVLRAVASEPMPAFVLFQTQRFFSPAYAARPAVRISAICRQSMQT